MKKSLYLIVALLMCFMLTEKVSALGDNSSAYPKEEKYFTSRDQNDPYWYHTLTDGTPLLCIQPGYQHPSMIKQSCLTKKELKVGSNKTRKFNAYTAGMAEIYTHAKGGKNVDYIGAVVAARFWNYLFSLNGLSSEVPPMKSSTGSYQFEQYRIVRHLYNMAINGYTDNGKKLYFTTNDNRYMNNALKDLLNVKTLKQDNYNANTSGVAIGLSLEASQKALQYIKDAIDAAEKAVTKTPTAKIFNASKTEGGITYTSKDKRSKITVRKVEYSGLDKSKMNPYVTIAFDGSSNISFVNGFYAASDYNTALSIAQALRDGKTPSSGHLGNGTAESRTLNSYIKSSGSGTLYIINIFTKSSISSCIEDTYTIKIHANYKDGTANNEIYYYSCPNNPNTQAFVTTEKGTGVIGQKNKVKLNMCTKGSCEDYQQECEASGNANSQACQDYKKNYGKNLGEACAECTTKVENPACAEGEQQFNITEGVDKNGNSCGSVKNVKDCIVGQVDIANNSYEATTSGYPSASSNPYCKVFCTEDYNFTMPGAQTTNSGRYLVGLQTSISGTKSCYTNRIDTEQFETDIEQLRKKLIDAFNEWSYYYNGVNNYKSDSYDSGCHTSCDSCDVTKYIRTWDYDYVDSYSRLIRRTDGYSANDGTSYSCQYRTCVAWNDKGKCIARACVGSSYCHQGSDRNIGAYLSGILSTKLSVLQSALRAYTNAISQFNSCSLNINQNSVFSAANSSKWQMSYKFQPTIGFWYQDTYMSIAQNKQLNLVSGGTAGNFNAQVCNGDVDSTYGTCIGGSWVDARYGHNNNSINKITCYATGRSTYTCGNISIDYSSEKYVKQSMSASGTYRLPSQYYIIFPGGKTVTDKVEGASLLEEKLPISLNAAAGTYTYTLTVQGLGEYYNNNKTGRIWGDSDSVMYTALESDNACKADGALKSNQHDNGTNGEYVCAYKINCPNCPVTCVGDNCSTTVDCPGNNCHAYCDKCVFKLGKQNFTYRQISTDSINPNNRVLGANWNYKDNITTKTEMKACVATNEILATGEKAYDTDSKDNDVKVMKVNLTQSMINSIKKYNKDKESEGGFGDNSLECYSYNDGEKTYNGVFCYSKFLDEYVKGYSNKFTFYKDRLSTENARKGANNQCTGNNCYWTTWNQALDSGLSVTTNNCRYTEGKFTGIVDGDSKDAIGPSYR